ncbi:endonuclease NucS domain-containing protein [Lysobacter soli]|uniref:endonuclease NucS domain-containing protein n=1 Tax=Lysobacter soli TaxID=453783 RepID=UPI0024100539|nr:endonuclease NucS domain-containing protein [Lysobacter soli]MDG2518095.1 endonuclease NucS [Lysobacter soli]
MSDIQLFRLAGGSAVELPGRAAAVEKQLQALIERHMQTFLGVRFLASEYATGKTHKGRIDSLGIDENNCPVIVEYKRHSNENVINQGLFYLDWLLDHQAEFRWLVMERLGKDVAEVIDWSGTRLLCIAADFTRYDQHAVQQIPRNIELLRYKLFADDLLLLELVNAVSVADVTAIKPDTDPAAAPKSSGKDKSFDEQYAGALPETRAVYEALAAYVLALGDDVTERRLKLYTAFRRLKNFVSVVMYPSKMLVMLKVDPDTVALEDGFSRDVRQIGHWGTGDLELTVRTMADLDKSKSLLDRSYHEG